MAPPPTIDNPAVLLDQLIESVDDADLEDGLRRSLLAQLVNARSKLDNEMVVRACGMLESFGNELAAQDGQGVPSGLAADWQARLARIEELLDCQ